MKSQSRFARLARLSGVVALLVAVPLSAGATVRKEGAWPSSEKKVDLEFEGPPSEGLSKLADEAGWSLVVSKGIDLGVHDVKINVDDQPADAVLEALFADSDVVARRNGSLVTIMPVHAGSGDAGPSSGDVVPPVPPVPAVSAAPPVPPPVPTVRGSDRDVFGNSLTIAKDETVHTLTVTGGSVTVLGTVTGVLVVFGGSAKIEPGAHVVGNATVFGGSLHVRSGARMDGDVGIVGGSLEREPGAIISGKVVDDASGNGGHGRSHGRGDRRSSSDDSASSSSSRSGSTLRDAIHDFGQSLTNMSLLFVLGCVLLALATKKMDTLRTEVAARPMRSFAMGIVGSIAFVVGFCALLITIVGIPFALLALLIGVFSLYASICTVLVTFGAAVAGHKTKNPYVHLLIGCLAFLVVGAIPYVGGLLTFAITMIALGALVSTRLAGVAVRNSAKPRLV